LVLLEGWHRNEKIIHFDDSELDDTSCRKSGPIQTGGAYPTYHLAIVMKGCYILYGHHKLDKPIEIKSKQDSNIAILSFQLGGEFHVNEPNYQPYRTFDKEKHVCFFTNKRELVFEAPQVFENFRIILSATTFQILLAKFHGRFSVYSEKVVRGEYFDLFDVPLPITPKIKLVINSILAHRVSDPVLSKVFYETKITELFGCQLEQYYNARELRPLRELTERDKEKILAARKILLQNIADNPPSLSKLSRLVGINEHKLKSGFREMFGKSVFNYLLQQRIERSVEMMENPDLSLDEISELVGYADSAHFSRAFKRVKGLPPGQFRNEITNKGKNLSQNGL